jgi:hypothetical protein
MHTPEEPEKEPHTEPELPLWIKSLEKMRPEMVKAVLQIGADYNLPIQDIIEDALREKLERYLIEHPEIRELVERILEQQKRQGPKKKR